MRVEHEYDRGGAWAYMAALDVHRAKLFGRCERTTGIVPFDRLVTQVHVPVALPPGTPGFLDRRQRFLARGAACVHRLQTAFPKYVAELMNQST